MHNVFQIFLCMLQLKILGLGHTLMINVKHITAYFTVVEWLGSDCQAAQLDGFLEPGRDLQPL